MPDADQSDCAPSRTVTPDISLRTQQYRYVEYIAEKERVTLSRALQILIEKYDGTAAENDRLKGGTRRERIHFSLSETHLLKVDLLAGMWGIYRSDVVRRIIDEARTRDPTI